MRSCRAILSVKWTSVSARGGVRQAVGAFLRYIHYRDQHVEPDEPGDVGRLLRYVAHRDRSSSKGRLFNADHVVGDPERRALNAYVVRSTQGLRVRKSDRTAAKAVYRMVLSPEDAGGLDLRQMARATMAGLQASAGELPPWIAAEHRNTRHPHVHIVLAARRETPDGFRALVVTPRRLALMKEALALEVARQRGQVGRQPGRAVTSARPRDSRLLGALTEPRRRHRAPLFFELQLLAARYRHYLERELEEDLRRRERELRREWSR